MNGKIPSDDIRPIFEKSRIHATNPEERPHVLIVGSQECQTSIERSLVFPSKEEWEAHLKLSVGNEYKFIISETLGAMHMAVYLHTNLAGQLKGN